MKKFSIIVPIYKIEDYIEECIKSVLNQEYDDYELILVDDGSPDLSGSICDRYAEENKNIIVIHKKNGGLSDARNAGIDAATGKYIMFLDGDDVLSKNALININNVLGEEEIDLLVCGFNIYGEDEKRSTIQRRIGNINDFFLVSNDIPWSAWRNVYHSNMLKNNNIYFKKNLVGAEDCEFFIRVVNEAKDIVYTDMAIVNYRTNRDGSITNNISVNAIKGQLEIFSDYFYKYYKNKNKRIYEYFAQKYLNTISTIYNIKNKEEVIEVIESINKNKEIFKYTKGFKYFIAKSIWSIFGYYNGSKLLKVINR